MLRGHGAHLDPAGHRYTSSRYLPGAGGAPPASVSLETYLPPPLDQAEDSMCTGCERMQSDYATLAAQGTPVPMLSPRWPYIVGRAIDRQPDVFGSLAPLQDTGAQPNQIVRAVQAWGHVAHSACPQDPARPDDVTAPADHAHANDEPPFELLEEASAYELAGAYSIDEGTPEAQVQSFKRALASCRCVGFTIPVTDALDRYTGGVFTSDMLRGPSRGFHRVLFYGYATAPDGTLRVYWRNSWSKAWGLEGNAVGDESFLLAAWNMIVANVRRR